MRLTNRGENKKCLHVTISINSTTDAEKQIQIKTLIGLKKRMEYIAHSSVSYSSPSISSICFLQVSNFCPEEKHKKFI